MNNVLVVCIGNICRSPMAEVILRAAMPNLHVVSAGLGALTGNPAEPIATLLMKRRGIDLSQHRAQQITLDHCRNADLILVMDVLQRSAVGERYPFSRGKIFRIAENLNKDVPDPYRRGEGAFEESLSLIDKGLEMWIDRISRINEVL